MKFSVRTAAVLAAEDLVPDVDLVQEALEVGPIEALIAALVTVSLASMAFQIIAVSRVGSLAEVLPSEQVLLGQVLLGLALYIKT